MIVKSGAGDRRILTPHASRPSVVKQPPVSSSLADSAEEDLLLELLQLRRGALRHEWALESVSPLADDDLLPARERIEESMLQVSIALQRERQGRQGCCARCAGAITFEPLLAHPIALLCWPCQEASERDSAANGPH
jgi:RNA polymerase-binding transcription factor DksA